MKAPLVLRTAIGRYDHVQALRDGSVASERLRLDLVEVEPITRGFRRMVRELAFDLCEIALATHAQAHEHAKPITALPIVLARGFHHAALVCRRDSPLAGPRDLMGKRVGVRAWSQTTGAWVRGILQSEYGLDPKSVTWVTTEDAHVAEYRDPPHVVRAASGETLLALLLAGKIDAAVGLKQADPNDLRTVIPDAALEAERWYCKTGIYPVNHVIAVRDDLLAAHPWLGRELMDLFTSAKQHARAIKATDSAEDRLIAMVGADPLPYGMSANRRSIDMLLSFAAEQGLVAKAYRAADLFAPGP
ncbi:MAG: ABC transporter substrate-binding protein [Acetobacteraceae bacterium]